MSEQQQQQQQESLVFMPTEDEITPKMSKLFADIDKLIDQYVVDVKEYPLETTQRFVGWHVCQDFYTTFCKSFAPPGQPRQTSWNVYQKEEYARYVAEQKRTEQPIEKYSNMQGYFSEKFDEVKKENPGYYEQLKETAKRINELQPRDMSVKARQLTYVKQIKQLQTSLEYMKYNYNMHYMFAYSHVTTKHYLYPKGAFVSEGGAERTWRRLQKGLHGSTILDCLNDSVYFEVGRKAALNAARLAAARINNNSSLATINVPAENESANAENGESAFVDDEMEDLELANAVEEEDQDQDMYYVDSNEYAYQNVDDAVTIIADDSTLAIPRIVRGVTAIDPNDMPIPLMSTTTTAPFEPAPTVVDTQHVHLSQQQPKPKLSKIKADLRSVLIKQYSKLIDDANTCALHQAQTFGSLDEQANEARKNFPWKAFAGPDAKYRFKGWRQRWGEVPASFEDIEYSYMEELLDKLNKDVVRIRVKKSKKKSKKRKTNHNSDAQERNT